MSLANRISEMYNVHGQTRQTTRDSSKDISDMVKRILESCSTDSIDDPCALGWKKIKDGWMENAIQNTTDFEEVT